MTPAGLRLSVKLRTGLEAAAKAEKAGIDAILTRLAREWLAKRGAEEQGRLREQAMKAVGTVSIGGPSATNAEVRKVMGEYLEAKYRASQRRALGDLVDTNTLDIVRALHE